MEPHEAGGSAPKLSKKQGLTAARLAGAVSRVSTGDAPFGDKLAEILVITRDPQILGQELGSHLAAEYPNPTTAAAIELLRAAGADEDQAELTARWQRWKRDRRADGGFTL